MEASVRQLTLTINGRQITAPAGETVLQTALRHGISIPHLCTHPNLPPFGACRMCIVEIDGLRGYPASCSTPATEGMVVRTDTPTLQNLRRSVLELILAEHPSACLVCDKRELCEKYRPKPDKAGRTTGCNTCNNKQVCEIRDLSESIGLTSLPYVPFYRHLPVQRSEPFIRRDLNLCILCGRCVRICKHQHGLATIDYVARGSRTYVGTAFGRSLREAGCTFCGSCVDVCPTGSLAERYAKWYGGGEGSSETTCILCDAGCAIRVVRDKDRAVTARAINEGVPICVLGRFGIPPFLGGKDRLRVPRVRYGLVLREVGWETAIARARERLQTFTGDSFALVCETTASLEDRHVFGRFTCEVMKSSHLIEVTPDACGKSRADLPAGVKAAWLMGKFVEAGKLAGIELLILQDCYPGPLDGLAEISFPAAVLAEIDGTVSQNGDFLALRRACLPPGFARPDWSIVADVARALGATGFTYKSTQAVATEAGLQPGRLRVERGEAPPAAMDPRKRWTHFRGHNLEEKVIGLTLL